MFLSYPLALLLLLLTDADRNLHHLKAIFIYTDSFTSEAASFWCCP